MRWTVVIMLSLLLAGCAQPHPDKESTEGSPMPSTEQVQITTTDNVKLAATFYDGGERGVILLHQFRHDKGSWDAFAKELQHQGYSVVAVDLRGHGESQGNWQSFSDQDFIAMLNDAEAAGKFLQQRGKRVSSVMGASIGANTAFRYSSLHKIPGVLLSPGLEYKGIDVNDITSTAATLIVVAEGDTYAAESSRELDANNLFGGHELLVVPGAAHGTYLLAEQGVTERILGFLQKNVK